MTDTSIVATPEARLLEAWALLVVVIGLSLPEPLSGVPGDHHTK